MTPTAPLVGRRFTAGWMEGVATAGERPEALPDGSPPPMPAAWAFAIPTDDPDVRDTIRVAREAGLPTLLDPAGMRFADAVPVLFEHEDPQAGHLTSVHRDGVRFEVAGWIYSPFADLAARRWAMSPGLQLRRAEIVTDTLFVLESEVVELSVCLLPARDHTWFRLADRDETIPERERPDALQRATFRAITDEAEHHFAAMLAEREAFG